MSAEAAPRPATALPVIVQIGVEMIPVAVGGALFVWALVADAAWFDRHFLPLFSLSRPEFLQRETLGRIVVGLLGLGMALTLRPLVGKLVTRTPPGELLAGTVRIALAVGLALIVTEPFLRDPVRSATEAALPGQEPLRRTDPRLGWTFAPDRVVRLKFGSRSIPYAFDKTGARVESLDRPIDPTLPSILFTGESIVGGFGLTWDEAIPAQTGRMLGLQSADLSVFAYSNDQAYLRLADALPRFKRPVAVVSLFMPNLIFRNLNTDRPYVGPDLVWRPAQPRWRLAALALYVVPYRTTAQIERGVARTRAVLQATARLACARGARPLVLVPELGDEDVAEARLRHAVLDQSGLDYVRVRVDPAWRVPGDRHPDARAARVMAAAIAARLKAPPVQACELTRTGGRPML